MNNSEEIRIAVNLLQKLGGSYSVYWNILIGGSTAAIGFAFKGGTILSKKAPRVVLLVTYLIFAMSNLVAIRYLVAKNQKLLSYLSELNAPEKLQSVFEMSLTKCQFTTFHLVMQALVLVLIWIIPKNKSCIKQSE